MESKTGTIPADEFDATLDRYVNDLGYRLDMVVPADSPSAAIVSKDGESIRLIKSSGFRGPNSGEGLPEGGTANEWITGRAGMMYRDLIPGRMGGKIIASHIRLEKGGEVADYVHYHKVDFQMIYCLRGRIKVVYEDQGPPFWLEPGDCVLQPPEIRHRVLECTAGSEVIEIGMPAVHETWVEHDIQLPTATVRPDRDFGGQRFVRHIAADAVWAHDVEEALDIRDVGISAATNNFADVFVTKLATHDVTGIEPAYVQREKLLFMFVLNGNLHIQTHVGEEYDLAEGDSYTIPPNIDYKLRYSASAEALLVSVTA